MTAWSGIMVLGIDVYYHMFGFGDVLRGFVLMVFKPIKDYGNMEDIAWYHSYIIEDFSIHTGTKYTSLSSLDQYLHTLDSWYDVIEDCYR